MGSKSNRKRERRGTDLRNTLRTSTSKGMQLVHEPTPTCAIYHAALTAGIGTKAGGGGDMVVAGLAARLPHLCQQTGLRLRPEPPTTHHTTTPHDNTWALTPPSTVLGLASSTSEWALRSLWFRI